MYAVVDSVEFKTRTVVEPCRLEYLVGGIPFKVGIPCRWCTVKVGIPCRWCTVKVGIPTNTWCNATLYSFRGSRHQVKPGGAYWLFTVMLG